MTPAEAASRYLSLGWSVVPGYWVEGGRCACGRDDCPSPGKHPLIRWRDYSTKRPTAAEVSRWWTQWPKASVLVVTGAISGIVVVDIDAKDIDTPGVVETLGEWPDGPICLTGGGGYHLYFAHPGGTVPNRVRFLPGWDVRGDGGYVVAPPSSHISGRVYEWEVGHSPFERPLPPMPARLAALLQADTAGDEADINELLHQPIPEGQRDVTLTKLAGWFFNRQADLDPLAAFDWLWRINVVSCKPPLALEQVLKIVKSIYRREKQQRETNPAVPAQVDVNALWSELGLDGIAVAGVRCYRIGEDVFYKLELADGRLVPLGTSLIAQNAVRQALANHLRVVLPLRSQREWLKLIAPILAATRDYIVEPVPAQLVSDWFTTWLSEYPPVSLSSDDRAAAAEQLRHGYPVEFESHIWFRLGRFLMYLDARLGVRITAPKLARYLREANFEKAWFWYQQPDQRRGSIECWRRRVENTQTELVM